MEVGISLAANKETLLQLEGRKYWEAQQDLTLRVAHLGALGATVI